MLQCVILTTKSVMDKSLSAVTNGSSPKVVADIILKVAMTEEPRWRYLAGVDAVSLFKTKKDTTDLEFEKLLSKILDL
jgi:hypothetical protein